MPYFYKKGFEINYYFSLNITIIRLFLHHQKRELGKLTFSYTFE